MEIQHKVINGQERWEITRGVNHKRIIIAHKTNGLWAFFNGKRYLLQHEVSRDILFTLMIFELERAKNLK